ncbi:conjugal transfer protein TraG [Youhaiella tibetensis]|uniref:Type IV secretory system conjugative DNA transfer family protein n=1 Tax=Paradevosia tibetensis TaxID=1447062 RepID=A0A5B9DJB5_9HYPH|nr:type IV secretory system conjugative DNA transfer family protein [Youhaiella tibetensis]QEE19187.1 type IV secretory system conjugative DNA transfer family protein [Youhaiella tibetensis]GGF35458.1 conjugal transfer protein TraG [Youhaiella tibetensis]
MNMNAEAFPPRGSGTKGRAEWLPSATWGNVDEYDEWTWRPGRLLLGRKRDRLIGFDDDSHAFIAAKSRAGKTSTVLLHNLARYPGSVFVTDPKGELALHTAQARRDLGQRVFVLDPFDVLADHGVTSAAYNPFSELGYGKPRLIAPDAALAGDAIIVANDKDPHWTDSARNLVRSIVLFTLATEGKATLRKLRKLLQSSELTSIFERMVLTGDYDEVVSNAGSSFLAKARDAEREFASILSTAQEQTAPLDDIRRISDVSDFSLADLPKGGITIYAVLPGMLLATHFRWLRMLVQSALAAVERHPVPRGNLPVLFMLEEFAALGHMRSIEMAIGLLGGAGARLWPIVQDLNQLKMAYPNSWETFLSNAGTLQIFAVNDLTTAEYVSKRLGQTQVVERHSVRTSSQAMSAGDSGVRETLRTTRLLEPDEIMRAFARETNRQLIITPHKPPVFIERMDHYG